MPVVGVEPTRVIRTRDFEFLSSSSIWCHPVISSDIWFPLCKGKIHASTNNNLKYPRFFDAFFLYSVCLLYTSGFLQQGVLGECNRQYLPGGDKRVKTGRMRGIKKKSSPKPFDFELLAMPVVGGRTHTCY